MHWLVTGSYGEQPDAGCAAAAGFASTSTLYRWERPMLIGIAIYNGAGLLRNPFAIAFHYPSVT